MVAGQVAGAGLVAETFEDVCRGADERQAGGLAAAGEFGVLGEEAIAGMNGVAAVGEGDVDDLLLVEVRAGATSFQGDGLVGLARMQRGGVILGVNRQAVDIQFGGGAGDADGDLATVGDEQAGHGHGDSGLWSAIATS